MLGRQYIVTLPTGDYNYKTSQALLWVPPAFLRKRNTKQKFPLIINLYGQGQCGTNLKLMLSDHTMSRYIADGFNAKAKNPKDGKTYSFFVCSPQCPTSWGWSAPQVNVMLQKLIEKLPIDQSRIYITGFSSGGWGLWSCMTDNNSLTKRFAAIVPISSAAADHPDKITNVDKYGIACLNVCGDQDAFYPNAVSYTNIINSNNPPIPAILKTLKGVGHSAWVQAYDPNWKQINKLNIYEWMIQNHQ
jgi:predicted peptidase